MFLKVLVPLDGSAFAEQALPWALAISRRAGARLDLMRVHVLYALADLHAARMPYDPALEAACEDQERLYLDGTARELQTVARGSVTATLVHGLGVDGILQEVKTTATDLVVMTTHGRGPVSRFFLGSVADELIRRAPVPVLLVRPHVPADGPASEPGLAPEPAVAEVLVPLDGSALAEHALGPATDLARLMDATCTLLRVIRPGPEAPGRPAEETEPEARDYLERIAARLRVQDLQVQTRVATASHAAEAILHENAARTDGVIALATHGRGGVRRMLLGSVADKVIRAGSTPVLVCRPSLRSP